MSEPNEAPPAVNPYASAIRTLDLVGTFVFGVEGAVSAMKSHLDLFGIMIIAFFAALGGGIARDLLIGDVPPSALRYVSYPITAFVGGLVVFFFRPWVGLVPEPVLIALDAAGLSLFAIAGAVKSVDLGINSFVACLLGAVTGTGGGVIRDVLLNRIPLILRTDIYAVAALFGSAITITALHFKLRRTVWMVVGGIACFGLREISVWQHWSLPHSFGA